MATRTIRNKKTGEIRVINDSEVGKYGIAPQTQQKSGVRSVLETLGLGAVGDMGSAAIDTARMFGDRANYDKATDPTQKAQYGSELANRAQSVNKTLSKYGMGAPDEQGSNFDPAKFATQTAKGAAGMASWAVPVSKGGSAANYLKGAGTNFLSGAMNEISKDDATIPSVVSGGISSGVFGAGLNALGDAGKAIKAGVSASSKRIVGNTLKGSAPVMEDYAKKTGGRNFLDDFMERDFENVKNMAPDEMEKYFGDKKNVLDGVVDKFLDQQQPVKKMDIVKIIFKKGDEIKTFKRNPEMVNVAGRAANKELADEAAAVLGYDSFSAMKKAYNKWNKNPKVIGEVNPGDFFRPNTPEGKYPVDTIKLATVNELKRIFETKAKTIYSDSNTKKELIPKAYGDLASRLGKFLEDKAKGYKALNRQIQYAHVADDIVTRFKTNFENKLPLPARLAKAMAITGVGTLGGAMVGQPGIGASLGAISAAQGAGNDLLNNPQAQMFLASVMKKVGKNRAPAKWQQFATAVGSKTGRAASSNVPAVALRDKQNEQ